MNGFRQHPDGARPSEHRKHWVRVSDRIAGAIGLPRILPSDHWLT